MCNVVFAQLILNLSFGVPYSHTRPPPPGDSGTSGHVIGIGPNKYGSVQELRSTFGHLKSFKILG